MQDYFEIQGYEVIIARGEIQVSSTVLVGSRLTAMVTMMMIPVILLSLAPMIDCITSTNGSGMELDYLAFTTDYSTKYVLVAAGIFCILCGIYIRGRM